MPENITTTVSAHMVRKGDIFDGAAVTDTDSKTKFTYITLDTAPRVRIEMDALIEVTRPQATKAENDAALVITKLHLVDGYEASDRKDLAAARGKEIARLQVGTPTSHWDFGDLPYLETKVQMWDAVAHVHLMRCDAADAPVTRLEAIAYHVGKIKDEVMNVRLLSRSFSATSNFMEDIALQAKIDWVGRTDAGW